MNKENVTIEDIQSISKELNIVLNPEQLNNVLSEYNKVVMDKGEGWDELVKILIIKQGTIYIIKNNQHATNNREYK